MIKGKDILFWAGLTFDKTSIGADLAKTLAEHNRIFYIEYPESLVRAFYHRDISYWWNSISRLILRQRLRKPYHNIIVYVLRKIPFLFITYPEFVRCLVLKLNIWFVKKYLKQQKYKDIILIVLYPTAYEVLKEFDKDVSVYYCIDDYAEQPEYKQYPRRRIHIEGLERKTLKESNICLFSSDDLLQKKKQFCSSGSLLKAGVDVERFNVSPVSFIKYRDKEIKEPIVGFIGGINDRFDWNILEFSAKKLHDVSFVFIGIGRGITQVRKKISNLYFLGEMEPEDLGAFVVKFCVGIRPYVVDSTTTFINPVKIYEYLAAGLPIVSTPLPDVVKMSEDLGQGYIYIADSPETFSNAIQQALKEDSPEKRKRRKNLAENYSWEKRAEQFAEIIESYKQRA